MGGAHFVAAIVPTCFVTYDLLNSSFHGNVERGVSTEVLIFAVVSVIPYLASSNVSRRIIIPLLPTPSVASISQDRDSFHISVQTAPLQNLTEAIGFIFQFNTTKTNFSHIPCPIRHLKGLRYFSLEMRIHLSTSRLRQSTV